ncbi:MAG: DUF2207 domain-containing protein, partial [Cucumibacter sp.]
MCPSASIRHLRFLLVALVTAALFGFAPARAAEVIRSFSADIALLASGSVDVTEFIEVRAEGNQIRRGIYRDIPTILLRDDGFEQRSNLAIVSVERNGRPEPWHTESLGDGWTRLYIGDADVYLSTGVYRYALRYTMTRQARRFDDHDELYWSATGNFWSFPILAAVATVTLPEGATITQTAAYTGAFGEAGADATVTRENANRVVFRANRTLDPEEGMTVVVGFAKGALAEPGAFENAINYLSDFRNLILPALAAFLVLLYNFFAWEAVGRDPQKGVIVPLFHAPQNFSPALTHYVHRMGWRKGGWIAFTAALVSLAVKGLIVISQKSKKSTFTVTGKAASNLPPGEKIIYDWLRAHGTLTIDTDIGQSLHDKQREFMKAIEDENRQVFFNRNTAYVVGGVLLSVICLGALVLFDVLSVVWLLVARV